MVEKELGAGGEIVALVRDLMFGARVRGAAPDAVVKQRGDEVVAAVGPHTRLLIVELEAPDPLTAIRGARERGAARIVAFAPHVREELIAAAEEAGAEVLSRGAFVKRLPALVREALSGR